MTSEEIRDMKSIRRGPMLKLTIADMAKHISNGEISAQELAEAVISAAERHADLNAYATFDADALRAGAKKADAALNRN